jgi:hypothetical protein
MTDEEHRAEIELAKAELRREFIDRLAASLFAEVSSSRRRRTRAWIASHTAAGRRLGLQRGNAAQQVAG